MGLYGNEQIFTESVSQVTATPSVDLGTRRYFEGNDYLYCYNAGAEAIGKGEFGRLPGSSLSSGYSVTVTNAAAQVGGIAVVGVAHNAAIAASSYGWLCTKGLVLYALDENEASMNSGDALAAGIDGGFVAATVTLSTGVRLGIALNSGVTTVGTAKAWFKSPLFG